MDKELFADLVVNLNQLPIFDYCNGTLKYTKIFLKNRNLSEQDIDDFCKYCENQKQYLMRSKSFNRYTKQIATNSDLKSKISELKKLLSNNPETVLTIEKTTQMFIPFSNDIQQAEFKDVRIPLFLIEVEKSYKEIQKQIMRKRSYIALMNKFHDKQLVYVFIGRKSNVVLKDLTGDGYSTKEEAQQFFENRKKKN